SSKGKAYVCHCLIATSRYRSICFDCLLLLPSVIEIGSLSVKMDTSQSSPNDLHHEGNVVPRASKPSPTAVELGKRLALLLGLPPVIEIGTRGVIMDASQSPPPNDRGHEVDVVPLVSKDSPTTEGARSGEPLPKAQYNSSDQHIAMAPETSEFTAHYRQCSRSSLGLPVEPFLVGPKELPAAKEALACRPAIRRLHAIHPIRASGWIGNDLSFPPGYE